jgi:hypothetical protein
METNEWINYFKAQGYPGVRALAGGMEGEVFTLGNGLVAKVWTRRRAAELVPLKHFYDGLSGAALAFATPCIREVQSVSGQAVTIEQELHGIPLRHRLSDTDTILDPTAVACIIRVLRGLQSVDATAEMRELGVLDEPQSFWADAPDWGSALIGLMDRRVGEFGSQLRAAVPGFDAIYKKILNRVRAIRPERLTALHGDVCSQNILVDDRGSTSALLDFGFLSTVGDPAFDVSIAGGIYNMYGAKARQLDDEFTDKLAREFNYPHEVLLLYRAVYAIITSNAYDPSGQDGHFAWCAAVLRRDALAALLT